MNWRDSIWASDNWSHLGVPTAVSYAALSYLLKRTLNLLNIFVKSDLKPAPHFLRKIPYGNYRCGNCQQCNFTYKTATFRHPHMTKTFQIRGAISCKTSNVIYCVALVVCYVGKTSRPLKYRIRHCDPKSPVAQDFAKSTLSFHSSVHMYRGSQVSTARW